MDPGSLSFPAAMVVMIGLLGAARISSGDEQNCICPEIPHRSQTQPPGKKCFGVGDRYRYTCLPGLVREAGTSNMIKCEQSDGRIYWTTPTLNCKPDPKLPTITVQTATSSSPQTTWSISSLATVTVGTEREETTIHATSAPWSETTMASNQTDSNSTHSGFFGKNDILPKAHKGTVPAVCISILIVMVCALIGLYVLYRRKLKKNINSQQSAAQLEELQQLKG